VTCFVTSGATVAAVLPAAYGTPPLPAATTPRACEPPRSVERWSTRGPGRLRSASVRGPGSVRLQRTPSRGAPCTVLPLGSCRRGASGHRPLFGFVPRSRASLYTSSSGTITTRIRHADLGELAQRVLGVIDVDRYGPVLPLPSVMWQGRTSPQRTSWPGRASP
jgi:hypothetical protein